MCSYQSLTGAFRFTVVIALRPINLLRAQILPSTFDIFRASKVKFESTLVFTSLIFLPHPKLSSWNKIFFLCYLLRITKQTMHARMAKDL